MRDAEAGLERQGPGMQWDCAQEHRVERLRPDSERRLGVLLLGRRGQRQLVRVPFAQLPTSL